MNKPIGYIEIKDGDKIVKVPYYHDSKMYCGCMKCKLARKEISVDFYKGFCLGVYINKLSNGEKESDDNTVKLFFSDDELIDFIYNY